MSQRKPEESRIFSVVHAESKIEGTEEAGGGEEGGAETTEESSEEIVDVKEAIDEACGDSTACKPFKHHLEQCTERVEAGGTHENCVEELFHFLHCVNNCAAPKLFEKLK
ncbi:hypothetical protein Glove_217g21 [Diversispora epigaea]|uniref:Ubiquinol-cytochrome C reductase hinge domain-containing protein n=1 Tax=Diversispora epigaea TaxID=1348612 RepID=A0A397IR31_9GLOM|nr:hypothetical protein Glove_217g21 [Diversispora epigaea]